MNKNFSANFRKLNKSLLLSHFSRVSNESYSFVVKYQKREFSHFNVLCYWQYVKSSRYAMAYFDDSQGCLLLSYLYFPYSKWGVKCTTRQEYASKKDSRYILLRFIASYTQMVQFNSFVYTWKYTCNITKEHVSCS